MTAEREVREPVEERRRAERDSEALAARPDLGPAARQLADLVRGVDDGQLDQPTPCADWSVADLCRHVIDLAGAFTAAATRAEPPESMGLDGTWRQRGADHLTALADAWNRPEAWTGDAKAGGVRMPAAELAVVALDELVLHAWDLARATGQDVHVRPQDAEVCLRFAIAIGPDPDERAGLYGPAIDVGTDAPALYRLLGASGRTPTWAPPRPRTGASTFVLVHGAWADGRSWDAVAPLLRARRHHVLTPTLAGLEADTAPDQRAQIRLDEHVDQLVALLDGQELNDVVLVAHSYSGVVVGQVADRLATRAPHRVRRSVHVASFLPRDGRSLLDDWGGDLSARRQEKAQVEADGHVWAPPPSAALEQVPDLDDRARHILAEQFVPHPGRTVLDPARMRRPITGQALTVVLTAPTGTGPPAHVPPELIEGVPGPWRLRTLATGHWPMHSVPQDLADLLESEAAT